MKTSMGADASNVTATLMNALNQSQALVREVESVKHENERLRRDVAEAERKMEEVSFSLEQNFRKAAERQAVIYQLKQQLAQYTEEQQLPPPKALSRSTTPGLPHTHLPRATSVCCEVQVPSSSPLRPPRKRARSSSPTSQAIVDLTNRQEPHRKVRVRNRADRGAAAIPTVAEDGEIHYPKAERKSHDVKPKDGRATKAHHRLDTLLSDSPPAKNVLIPRPDQRFVRRSSSDASSKGLPSFRKAPSDTARSSGLTDERPRARFLPPVRQLAAKSVIVREPLRRLPVDQLTLSHFKLNPNMDNGYYFTSDEALRHTQEMAKITETLGSELDLSDDDLLMQMLGSGSEDRIRTMTVVARQNLVEEARATRAAKLFGKMRCSSHQRAQSPTGFWNADMPSSSEARRNKEEARRREKEEIQRRCHEACQENGRWMFADE
jgi:hypothetical protein